MDRMMKRIYFQTDDGINIPAVDEDEMREIDRITVEQYRLGILQMMENAGRTLAQLAMQQLSDNSYKITILAGSGGNGGGGLCCARHLLNHGYKVGIIPTKPADQLYGAAKSQWMILESAGVSALDQNQANAAMSDAVLIIDALIGYSLKGPPEGAIEQLIHWANQARTPVPSLNLPSGINATSGDAPSVSIRAESTLTLALPKTGLQWYQGALFLADIGIPPQVYQSLGFELPDFPTGEYVLRLTASRGVT
jgi:NAD(P)H-hydrate epimerase